MQQPERTIKAMKSLSNSDKLDKKQREEQLKEDFAAYICDELCKHTMKKEANLIKQCERCRVDEFMKELKRKWNPLSNTVSAAISAAPQDC